MPACLHAYPLTSISKPLLIHNNPPILPLPDAKLSFNLQPRSRLTATEAHQKMDDLQRSAKVARARASNAQASLKASPLSRTWKPP